MGSKYSGLIGAVIAALSPDDTRQEWINRDSIRYFFHTPDLAISALRNAV